MIEILLPVYNGEKYLKEQIDSVIKQSNQDWIIKVRNDGSSDNSQDIIDSYCAQYPQKIIKIDFPKENKGLVTSLNLLAEATPHGDYIMFADQDDVWFPDKIERSLREIKKIENGDIPAAVCSNVVCVDKDLNMLSDSFFKSQKFPNGIIGNISKMIALNIVQGCTLMVNRPALDLAFPLPAFLNVHDMWVGVITAKYGNIKYMMTPTMSYRQHGSNVLGEIKVDGSYYWKRLKKMFDTLEGLRKIRKSLPFNTNLLSIVYYKILFGFKRIFT